MVDALMVTSSFLPGHGGIESYLAELCSALAPRVAVIAPGTRDGKALPSDLGYPTIAGPGSMLVPRGKVARAVIAEAERLGVDRLVFGTPWPLVLLGPRLARAGLRYSVIVHGAELLAPSVVPILRGRLLRALAGAELLLPVSSFTGGRLERLLTSAGHQVPEVRRLYARVDIARFNPEAAAASLRAHLGLEAEARIVLCFGRLVRRKGVDRLIAALPAIASRVPEVALVIGGTGPELPRLQRLASQVDLPIVFAGRVPDESAPGMYALADVFALPAVDRWFGLEVEGLGVVLLEASACGTPCVTGRSGGTPEAVLDERTGYVVDASTNQLADRIAELLEDPERAKSMGAAARDHVAATFSNASPPEALLGWLS